MASKKRALPQGSVYRPLKSALKNKSKDELLKVIRSLKREIALLRKTS